ncbi:MAG: bifunctional biotin--[acetyl-CoA-carboxylase] ligase/biotin operon repressor BirA [Parashewanella sp.]
MAEQWLLRRQILTLLNEQTSFVSGEALAQQLNVSRMTISNHIDALEQAGVGIYSVKGKGYKLETPITLIDGDKLVEQVDARCFYFDEIDSTNSFMLKHADDLRSGDICIAEYQSSGRGRRGRNWVSPYASHLYCSLLWRFQKGMAQAMGLSLVVGCSLAKVLQDQGVKNVSVKWPNDVYLDGKKLAGILVEMTGQADGECQLVIGIGVNLSMPLAQAELIDQPWSDLSQQLPNKTQFAVKLHQQLVDDLKQFEQQGLLPFINYWQQVDLYYGKPIQLLMADNSVTGICQGIDDQGALLLEVDGEVKSFVGGEISVRSGR